MMVAVLRAEMDAEPVVNVLLASHSHQTVL